MSDRSPACQTGDIPGLELAGTDQYIQSRIETGRGEGTIATLRKVIDAPRLTIDDGVG